MKRIDPVEVVKQFVKLGRVPAPGAFRGNLSPGQFRAHEEDPKPGDEPSADGVGVLQLRPDTSFATLDPLLPDGYLTGFKRGFDGDEPLVYGELGQPEEVFVQGYLDGISAHLSTLMTLGYLDAEEV